MKTGPNFIQFVMCPLSSFKLSSTSSSSSFATYLSGETCEYYPRVWRRTYMFEDEILSSYRENTFNRLKHTCGTVFNTFTDRQTDRQTGRQTNRLQIYKTPKEYEDAT